MIEQFLLKNKTPFSGYKCSIAIAKTTMKYLFFKTHHIELRLVGILIQCQCMYRLILPLKVQFDNIFKCLNVPFVIQHLHLKVSLPKQ